MTDPNGKSTDTAFDEEFLEDPKYLCSNLITYIGNKRALLPQIAEALKTVKKRLGKSKLRVLDIFSGSGVVTRFFKAHASWIAANDFEDYARVISSCFLTNRSEIDETVLSGYVRQLNEKVMDNDLAPGFIRKLYAPEDQDQITEEDRVFYTVENATRIDNYRRLLEQLPQQYRTMLLAVLLSEASVHANTAGVFKGFYKDRATGRGRYGGTGADALKRIMGRIELSMPVLSRYQCDYAVFQEDANDLAEKVSGLDLVYVDPPYNQHPYGSNYFMLNLITEYRQPKKLSRVSGIPADWRRSAYNVRRKALPFLKDLLNKLDSKFLMISFNNEGFIDSRSME
ncbi:MAG: DNA modification methylase, partial [Candidatus Aegiribacteria sp.]|nr:DNA modification methylase [Candidatus Aegiribacteria sp.]MBD3294250.1 DNA modification methylase [Candidatus Fermentibacteria bacterium]